ncbi:MAG: ATP-dependent Clp protease proteolytic subunit [Bryobacteraceae bacterium]
MVELVADPRFRANPHRAVFVHGVIDEALVQRLTPEILRLQAASRSPITVYIDSPGGFTWEAASLIGLLRASNQELAPPCDLITVATRYAASAAADLLFAGDYVIAYPNATIHYHGVRQAEASLTVERASMLAEHLRTTNNEYAAELAMRADMRFFLRYLVFLRPDINDLRKESDQKEATNVDRCCDLLIERLSEPAAALVALARERCTKYRDLANLVFERLSGNQAKPLAELETDILKGILDLQGSAESTGRAWPTLAALNEHASHLMEFLSHFLGERFQHICEALGDLALEVGEREHLAMLDPAAASQRKAELVTPRLLGPWSLFVALCSVLQAGENRLTPADAFWLGLVDEVLGDASMPSTRLLYESRFQQSSAGT